MSEPEASQSAFEQAVEEKSAVLRDYCALLEVPPTCSRDELMRAYKKLARLFDPDHVPEPLAHLAPKVRAIFIALRQARDTLDNEAERHVYLEMFSAQKPTDARTAKGQKTLADSRPAKGAEPAARPAATSGKKPRAPGSKQRQLAILAVSAVALLAVGGYNLLNTEPETPDAPFPVPAGAKVMFVPKLKMFILMTSDGQPLPPKAVAALTASAAEVHHLVAELPNGQYRVVPEDQRASIQPYLDAAAAKAKAAAAAEEAAAAHRTPVPDPATPPPPDPAPAPPAP